MSIKFNEVKISNGPTKSKSNGWYVLLKSDGGLYIGVEISNEAFSDADYLGSDGKMAEKCAINFAILRNESEWKSDNTIILNRSDIEPWISQK